MSAYQTEQENFWAGEFGSDYLDRNTADLIPGRINLFSKMLVRMRDVNSVLELGANIGNNLHALHTLLPMAKMSAVEINPDAVAALKKNDWLSVCEGSLLDASLNEISDFTFTSGVLIHINPEFLPQAYEALYKHSNRYICVCEYYNPAPIEVKYRGHSERMFKRDFAGEMMEIYPDLKLLDYGFCYRSDPNYPMDDLTWFLMEKQK